MNDSNPRLPLMAPSILAADLSRLAEALKICEDGGADLIHFDVMDGHFVPNLTFGIPILEAVVRETKIPVDVHLMVEQPEKLLDRYLQAGASWVSVHWETSIHLDRTLDQIREGGARAGVALNPATPVRVLEDCLERLDFVLLMSVNPGFAGQPFLPYVLEKARKLRAMIEERQLSVDIEMDGGIGPATIRDAVDAGVGVCVAGSAVFGAQDPTAAIGDIRRQAAD